LRPAIEATALGKRYRRNWALRDCCLQVPGGRITALIGPNGAGKTTLLNLAIGLLAPDAGGIETLGWSPQRQPELVLGRVGYVPQDRPLYSRFTVADTLHLGRSINPRWDDRGAGERMRRRGIPLDRPIRKLSGGQRAQVSLALALGKHPDLLLLDEPASSLDPLARRDFLAELVDAVAADGTTVVLSSHLIADVERVCDYLVILADGRVQLAGDIDTIREEHKLLVGPRFEREVVPADPTVISAHHSGRESALLVRRDDPAAPPGWRIETPSLEELVLAYLGNPRAGALPAPQLADGVSL
jgi:ABC-2 type transport system ATP-binding protein